MFPAGPEVPTPDVIALRGVVRDELQFYPGFPGHLYHKSNGNPILTVMLAVSTITNGQKHCLLSKPPNDGGADPPVSRLHKARFLFGKGAVLDGKLTSSSCCTCTYLQLFNAIPRLAKKRVRISSFDPVYPKPKGRETSRAPKRAEICDSYTVLHL